MATYWDPFQEMDRLFAQMAQGTRDVARMPIDLVHVGDRYVLTADLPGIDPGSIDVSVDDRTLTIRAERSTESDDGDWLLRERPSGMVTRQLTVGRGLALDQIDAAYTDGVLTLTIPVAEEAKPRRIDVAHTSAPKTIESETAS